MAYSQFGSAADVSCKAGSVAKCPCPYSMSVTCGSQNGFISNKQPVKSVKLEYTIPGGVRKEITIQNPPDGVRDHYAADSSEWI